MISSKSAPGSPISAPPQFISKALLLFWPVSSLRVKISQDYFLGCSFSFLPFSQLRGFLLHGRLMSRSHFQPPCQSPPLLHLSTWFQVRYSKQFHKGGRPQLPADSQCLASQAFASLTFTLLWTVLQHPTYLQAIPPDS